ncbi:hypothetical protein AB6D11_00880 [Vibrio splendidus]
MKEEVRTVKVSVNGARRILVEQANRLREALVSQQQDYHLTEEVVDEFDQLACEINSLLHLSVPNVANFNAIGTDPNETEVEMMNPVPDEE